jgi:RimJ/RimL family protein N-acetyltransferase
MPDVLTTDRLILRRWLDTDRVPFARMNSDLRVMEFMPECLEPSESDRLVDRIDRHFATHGFGLYAAELRSNHAFAGYIGLSVPAFDAPFMPTVEIGWRLAHEQWGKGLATEGAREVARYAFQTLGLDTLVSFTTPLNQRSIRVMERIGMTHDPLGDFQHPGLEPGHPLRFHVLYRLSHPQLLLLGWGRAILKRKL